MACLHTCCPFAVLTTDPSKANWTSGFGLNEAGRAFHEPPAGYIDNATALYPSSWVLSSDQQWMYRSQGLDRTSVTPGESTNVSMQLCINCEAGQVSDWAVGAVLVYNRELTTSEVQQVEDYLSWLYGVALERSRLCKSLCTQAKPLGVLPTCSQPSAKCFGVLCPMSMHLYAVGQ